MFSDGFDRIAFAKKLQSQLRALRAVTGLSQQELAEKLGIVRSTYVGYENGTSSIPWEKCLALCFFFQSIPASRQFLTNYRLLPNNLQLED